MNASLLLVLITEMILLFRIEKKMWRTLYTPLNFLMLPYAAVLGITLVLSGRWGLVEFYYPSLIPWIIGLPLFAVPGWLFFLAGKRGPAHSMKPVTHKQTSHISNAYRCLSAKENKQSYRFLILLAGLVILFLCVRLTILLVQGQGMVGNEQFGQLFAGKEWAGHLLLFGTALMMMLLFENRQWPTWLISAFIIFFLFVYQVKSWIILPLLSVFLALLITKEVKLEVRMLLLVGTGAIAVFFASYLLIFLTDNGNAGSSTLISQSKSIAELLVHYVTSGTMGLSIDMQQGILEEPDLQHIFTPFYNLWYMLNGQPLISGKNPEFLYTGIALDNVRSFFGTLFVFTRPYGFALCCLFFGTVSHFFFWLFRKYKTTLFSLLYAWVGTILFMGWFDFFPYLSNVFEIPFWVLVIFTIRLLFFNFEKRKT